MAILQTSDFKGEFSVPTNSFSELQLYINKYEDHYLVRLFGVELFNLFKADLTGTTPQTPQTPKFTTVFNAFINQDYGFLLESKGIKELLIGFIYYHYMIDNAYKKTIGGAVFVENENAVNAKFDGYNLLESFNYSVRTAKAIQYFMEQDPTTYPEYDGICFEFNCGI